MNLSPSPQPRPDRPVSAVDHPAFRAEEPEGWRYRYNPTRRECADHAAAGGLIEWYGGGFGWWDCDLPVSEWRTMNQDTVMTNHRLIEPMEDPDV